MISMVRLGFVSALPGRCRRRRIDSVYNSFRIMFESHPRTTNARYTKQHQSIVSFTNTTNNMRCLLYTPKPDADATNLMPMR